MNKFSKLWQLCAVIAAASVLSSCSVGEMYASLKAKIHSAVEEAAEDGTPEPETPYEEVEQEIDNSITLGVINFDTYNPYATSSPTVRAVLGFVYEPLFTLDSDYRTYGVLADSYTVGSDGTSLSINLKHDVSWHDGDPLTADDVVYTMNVVKTTDSQYKSLLDTVTEFYAADEYTVNVRFSRPVPDSVSLFIFPIVKNGSITSYGSDFFPIGTGPFHMTYANGVIGLEAFEGHHDKRAEIDTINVKYIADYDKYMSLFYANEFDLTTSEMVDMTNFMPRSSSRVSDCVTNNMVLAGFNMQSTKFSDPSSRRAVSLLIDREAIATNIYYSRSEAARYAVNPSSWLNIDSKRKLKPDEEEAARILSEAGWYTDEEGKYYRDDVGYLSFEIIVNAENAERLAVAQTVSDELSAFGIVTSVRECNYTTFNRLVAAKDYDMFIGETELPPNCDLTSLISSDGNYFGYSDADADALLTTLSSVQTEADVSAAAQALYEKIDTDCPFAPICFSKTSLITGAKIKTCSPPSPEGFVRATENWSVK